MDSNSLIHWYAGLKRDRVLPKLDGKTVGSVVENSDVASSLLKREEIYPDSAVGSDKIIFSYNRNVQETPEIPAGFCLFLIKPHQTTLV